jgi:DNA ligase (NAD+)
LDFYAGRDAIRLETVVASLGIKRLNSRAAQALAERYGTLERWVEEMTAAVSEAPGAAWAELVAVPDVGEVAAEEVASFFLEARNLTLVRELQGVLNVLAAERPKGVTSAIAGKTVVFTGTLETVTRGEAKARAEALGAKVAGSVSGKTDYLVVGADAGSKAQKARELGVTTLSEQEWLELVGG